jgi:hypothetical protein
VFANGIVLTACSSNTSQQIRQEYESVVAEHDSLHKRHETMEQRHTRDVLEFEALSAQTASAELVRRHDSVQKVHAALLEAHTELIKQHTLYLQFYSHVMATTQQGTALTAKQLQQLGTMSTERAALRNDHNEIVAEHVRLHDVHKALMKELQRLSPP